MTPDTPLRRRRSLHYVSCHRDEALAAALDSPADLLCFDLEDSVPAHAKAAARERLLRWWREHCFDGRECLLRINAATTPWGADDLVAAARLPLQGVLVPKVEQPETLQWVVDRLDAADAHAVALWALIESPLGVLNAATLAASLPGRLLGLVLGGNDLAKGLRARHTPDRLALLPSIGLLVLAARAHGRVVIDAIHPHFADLDGWAQACRQAADCGFDGKSVIDATTARLAHAAFEADEAQS